MKREIKAGLITAEIKAVNTIRRHIVQSSDKIPEPPRPRMGRHERYFESGIAVW